MITANQVESKPKPGVPIESLPADTDLGKALADGVIDAFIHPHPPHSVTRGKVRARRLFANARDEDLRYYRKRSYFPIMHVVALRPSLVSTQPQIARLVMDLFEQAKR